MLCAGAARRGHSWACGERLKNSLYHRRQLSLNFSHAPPIFFYHRLDANRDLANAQQIDFSEEVKDWLAQVGANARKVGQTGAAAKRLGGQT